MFSYPLLFYSPLLSFPSSCLSDIFVELIIYSKKHSQVKPRQAITVMAGNSPARSQTQTTVPDFVEAHFVHCLLSADVSAIFSS